MGFRFSIAAVVILVHTIAIACLNLTVGSKRLGAPQSNIVETQAHIIVQHAQRDLIPVPEIRVRLVEPNLRSIQMVRFVEPVDSGISGVIASTSSPQLKMMQTVEAETYAQLAGVLPGQVETVLLVIEIFPDGSVGAVSVRQGSGNATVDLAAIQYAKQLRWTPGTIDHRAHVMRIVFPVTLTPAR
jgi:TonB family protein